MRVLLAEDSALLQVGVQRVLEVGGIEVVGVVAAADLVVAEALRLRPDLLLTDIRMPPLLRDDGLQAALEARRRLPGLPVLLLLSQHLEDAYLAALVAAGTRGTGYLLKERVADLTDFLDAVRRVAAGGSAYDPDVIARLVQARAVGPLDRLSPREREVLELMARGLSNTGIAGVLVLSTAAVEKHVRAILAKLDLPPDDSDVSRRVLAVLTLLRARPSGGGPA